MSTSVIGKVCPFCQTPIKPGARVIDCPDCHIPHHEECWLENRGCTTFGCARAAAGNSAGTTDFHYQPPPEAAPPASGPVMPPASNSSGSSSGTVVAILIVALVIMAAITISVVVSNRQAAERSRQAAEMALQQAQLEREKMEEIAHQQALDIKRANPVTVLESGVDINEPTVEKHQDYTSLGSRCNRCYVYCVLKNNLCGIEDQTISYSIIEHWPDNYAPPLTTNDSEAEWHIDKDGQNTIIYNARGFENGSYYNSGSYSYTIRINGKDVAEGEWTVP